MRVCDWIANYLYTLGVSTVHGLMGGGASGLNDGFIKQGKLRYICYHHEQGAGHAAIGESKFTGGLSVVNPTTGCGGTNCITSVLDAWQDSVPVLFLSGNVKTKTCSGFINKQQGISLRKYGIQEHHIVDTVKSITKFSEFITSVNDVAFIIQQAVYIATSGRPGPVWIDVPGDIQLAEMPEVYKEFVQPQAEQYHYDFNFLKDKILQSQRPLVLAGYGLRQSNCVNEFISFIEKFEIPFVSTYGARDYVPEVHELSIGAVGQRGSRAGNFALQNSDCLLILGSSLNASVVGYDPATFSPFSYKILVDIDTNELAKDIINIDLKCPVSLQTFFREMNT